MSINDLNENNNNIPTENCAIQNQPTEIPPATKYPAPPIPHEDYTPPPGSSILDLCCCIYSMCRICCTGESGSEQSSISE